MPESKETRQAFADGVRAALDNLVPHLPSSALLEVEEWLRELDRWEDGPKPPSPMEWIDAKEPDAFLHLVV